MFVLGFSNFEKSTEIRSENSSGETLVKSRFKARALYLNRGKVFWLFYLPNFQTVKKIGFEKKFSNFENSIEIRSEKSSLLQSQSALPQ